MASSEWCRASTPRSSGWAELADPPDGAVNLRRVGTEVLHVMSGDAHGASIEVDGELVIGRSSAELTDLRHDTEISRVHARIWRTEGGELMIEDLGSRNGTFLNGSRIHGPRLLHPGDWLRTGRTTMELLGDSPANGAPRYDALVEPEEPEPERRSRGAAGHIHLWPVAAILAALLAGAGLGAAVAASHRSAPKSTTMVVTRKVERPAPPPRIAAPRRAVALTPLTARDTFVKAFCGRSATAPRAICGCTYVELTRREPYALLAAQVAESRGRRIAPAIVSASRACGAG